MEKLSRRGFFSASAGIASQALALSALARTAKAATGEPETESLSSHVDREESHRVVVIGTGFGGSITALRLAEAGIDALVLERGRFWTPQPDREVFPRFTHPDERCAWLRNTPPLPLAPFGLFRKYTGILERIHSPDIDVVCGSGVGGSSLAYGGVMAKPTAELFANLFPAEIPYEEMTSKYYPKVQQKIGFSPMPDDIYGSTNYKVARMFQRDAEAAGCQVTRLNTVYDWDVVRGELVGKTAPVVSGGGYMYGASNGAKLSVDRNYLKDAQATGRIEVRPLHQVQAIEEAQGGYFVRCDRIDEEGRVIERIGIRAERVFLGGGSMGTTKLLLRARELGTLPRLNDQIGLGWANNGERVFLRLFLKDSTLIAQGGPPSVGAMFIPTATGPISLEIAPTAMPVDVHAMCIAAITVPQGRGRLVYNRRTNKVVAQLPSTVVNPVVNRLSGVLKQWDRDTGGVLLDFDGLMGPVTYHPLGGAVIGKACDLFGRVEGYSGLYVTDGSLMPGSAGAVNPAWTIAALAERCLERIVEDDLA